MLRLALPLTLLAACSGGAPAEPAGPDARGSALVAEKLCFVFRHVKETCRNSEDLVEVGDKTIKVEATEKTRLDFPGGAMRNFVVTFSLKGEAPSYGVEFVSKGTSVDNAWDRGAQEWAALAGTAVVDAMVDNGTSVATHRVSKKPGEVPTVGTRGPFRVYPGVSDFRGAPKGGPVVDHEGLMTALAGEIDGLDASGPHSVMVKMKIEGSSAVCEAGQIDGKDVGAVCERASAFAWAAPLSPYTVRQFYMLVPGEPVLAPAAPVEAAPEGGAEAPTAPE